jgi:hypothetical protein
MTVQANITSQQPVVASIVDDSITAVVSGGIGPAGAAGVSTVNGLAGAVTIACVGATIATAGQTITITAAQSWADLTGKPATFPPSAHDHVAANITDFVSAVVAAAPPTTNASLLTSGTLADARLSGNVVLTVDSRLSDAREWSAATVTQAEAEAGTDTTRRAFTVVRVWQAIAAWWAASSAKAKLDGIASGATANSSDATLLSRANHTGTQTAATISDFSTASVLAVTWTTITGKPATFSPSAHTHVFADVTGLQAALDAKAPLASPTFTGTVSGVTKAMIGLGSVDNVADASKPVSTAQAAADAAVQAHAIQRANHTGTQAVGTITGLGGAATLSVGTTAGTVAAGDDSRITGALSTATAATTYQPLDSDLTSIAALSTTTFGRSLLTQADAAATRTTIGLGSLATQSGTSSGTNTGDQTITITGDVTGSGTGAFAATLSASGVTAGTYASVTVDAKGRVTAGATTQAWSTITGTPTTLTGYGITDAAASSHVHSGSDITSGTVAPARLASGTASSSTYLRGDSTWATVTSGSSSASDLTSGTLANDRLTARARVSANLFSWTSFR